MIVDALEFYHHMYRRCPLCLFGASMPKGERVSDLRVLCRFAFVPLNLHCFGFLVCSFVRVRPGDYHIV